MKKPFRLHPRSNMLSLDHRLFREIDLNFAELNAAINLLSKGATPDQGQIIHERDPGIDDHGNLKGLVPILNPDLTIGDMNDDHSMYALLFGRPGGQELYGSRPGTTTSWTPAGTHTLAAQSTSGGGSGDHTTDATKWSGIPTDANAPVATGIILVLSTHSDASLAAGETNYHTTFTDSSGNTWTKLKEYSYKHVTQTETVSMWFTLVTTAMTATTTTMEAIFSTADHATVSLESYMFTMAAGLTVSIIEYGTDGHDFTAIGGVTCPAMTLTAVSGETLFIRGISDKPGSGADAYKFSPTAGFTPFTNDHTASMNGGLAPGTGFAFGQNARGEFIIISGTGPTSAPVYSDNDDHHEAGVFVALQISGSAVGSLTLGAANLSDAGKIFLENRDIRFAAGLASGKFKFDPLGSGGFVGILDFDGITVADRTYTFQNASGTLAFLSDITALGSIYLKLDGSNDPMTGDLNFGDNIATVWGTGNDAKLLYDGTNLLLDTAVVGVGAFKILNTVHASGNYAARQNILNIGHAVLQGGTTNTTAATIALGTILATDAGLSATQFGMAQGLDLTVTNTNATKAGLPKGSVAPYSLALAFNADTAVIGAVDAAALKINTTFTTASSALQTNVLAIISGNSTSIAALTGVQGCQFKATNTTTAGGDARGFTGYGDLSNASATGNGVGVYGFGSNSGNGANALSVSFFCNTVGPGDSRQHYDIIGTKHAIHGAVYITTATGNLKTSNPATHLTPPTGSSIPTSDLFVGAHAEIDDTLWLDKVGDALVFASGGNIVLSTTTGTKIGTGATQLLGFWNATPVAQDTGWSVSNVTTDRSFDANATSIDELADVLGTLITKLLAYGIIGA